MGKKGKSKKDKKVRDAVTSPPSLSSQELLDRDPRSEVHVPWTLANGVQGAEETDLERVHDGIGLEPESVEHEALPGGDEESGRHGGGTGGLPDDKTLTMLVPWWFLFVAFGLGLCVGAVIAYRFPMVE